MTHIKKDTNTQAFFELLRAGLWETEARLSCFEDIDLYAIMRMAEEQSVAGLLTAGLDHVTDVKVSQEWVLQLIGNTLQIEQRNQAMNVFIERLFYNMRKKGIYALLIKGQGVAQYYEKPLWRNSGDIDLFLSSENYEKAKEFLIPLASSVEPEADFKKHLGMTINGWLVELHGSLRNGLSTRIDRSLDEIQNDTFYGGRVRSCLIGETQVFMLAIENDIMYVFSHILDHFYKGGIGLRQICDWVRLIWLNREVLDLQALEKRIKQMGLMSEWKAFASLAVDFLGMQKNAIPFYDAQFRGKGSRLIDFVMEVGNMGHNRDMSYLCNKNFVVRKAISLKQRIGDMSRHARIFPLDSLKFFWGITVTGVKAVIKK